MFVAGVRVVEFGFYQACTDSAPSVVGSGVAKEGHIQCESKKSPP